MKNNNFVLPKCIGGIGIKKSNNGKQYYQQDRIYDATDCNSISLCLPSGLSSGSYMYLIKNLHQ